MPLVTERFQEGMPATILQPTEAERPGALDTLAAAFRQTNIVSSAYEKFTGQPRPVEIQDGYDPFDDIAGYEDHADRFIRSESPEETVWLKQRIRAELQDKDTIGRAGGWGFASALAAGVLDPATLASMMIPVAAPVAWGSRLQRIGAGVGAQAALDTASEAILHGLQETRTLAESAFNVGSGVLLTGALGALATRVPKAEFKAVADTLRTELDEPVESTVGAMRVKDTTLSDETIAKGGVTVAKSIGKINPVLRVFQSPYVEARRLVQELVNVPFMLNKNKKGLGTADSVEARANRRITKSRVAVSQDLNAAYAKYRERVGKDGVSLREFGVEVTKALRRGDVSEIAEVAKVAKTARQIFDADKKALQEVGGLPKDVKVVGAESYFPRVYNHRAIEANRGEFEERIRRWYAKDQQFAEAAEIDQAVSDTYQAIMGGVSGMAESFGPGVPAPLKARILSVPDEVLEPFLISDFDHVMNGYLRAVAPQIEMRRSFGSIDLKNELDDLKQAYQNKAAKATSDAEKAKLEQAYKDNARDLIAMRDRVLGQVGPRGVEAYNWVRAARLLRSYNYVRMLGMQTLSSMADAGRLVARYGLAKSGGAMARFLTNVKANKIAREDAKRMGTALEWTIDTRGATLAEIGDDLPGSRLEQLAQYGTQRFTRISGMATWNSSLKAMTSILEQDQLLRLARAESLTEFQAGKLAQFGIGKAELKRIRQQFEKHGETLDDMARARTELWDDREAARLVEDAVIQAADIVVLSRGAGDLPLLMDKEIVKTLMQFKSFGMASVTRTLVPMAQGFAHGDMATVNGAAVMLGLGAMSYYVRELASGREPDLSPGRVTAEALNWSGLLAYTPDIYDPVAGLFHGPRISRYTDRAPVETLLGPSLGTLNELYKTGQSITDLGITASDVHKFRKLLPLQNVFWLRRVINGLEGEAAEAIGAEKATTQDFMDRVTETKQVN